jgi:hypothetical protein
MPTCYTPSLSCADFIDVARCGVLCADVVLVGIDQV